METYQPRHPIPSMLRTARNLARRVAWRRIARVLARNRVLPTMMAGAVTAFLVVLLSHV